MNVGVIVGTLEVPKQSVNEVDDKKNELIKAVDAMIAYGRKT